jgi:ABC-type branched-subunit amino acid transport system ATPase component
VQPASGGSIAFKGADITRARAHARVAAGIAQSPQGRQIFGDLSVQDNLRLGAYLRRDAGIAQDMERVYSQFPILKDFPLPAWRGPLRRPAADVGYRPCADGKAVAAAVR